MDELINSYAAKAGLPPDLMRMAIILLSSYPFCAVLKRLPDNNKLLKEVYCLGISIFYMLGVYSMATGLRTLLISTLATYFITKTLRTSPFMPWLNFLFVMGHLFINHIGAQMHDGPYDVNEIDITGAQMVLCMKLTAFGWNVYDGAQNESSLSEFQKERQVREHPPLLDFITYAFFFPSLFTGPAFDYSDFRQWINLSMFDSTLNDPKRGRAKYRKIPRSGRVSTRKMVEGLVWIGLWTQIDSYINLGYAQSAAFTEWNIAVRLVYLYLLGFTFRLKYYGAWTISEGACILSGLGFNGKDENGKYKWNRLQNIDPREFELGQNTHTLLARWNMNTNQWLRYYIFLRVTPKGKKPGFFSTFATFFTSALWHGTRPGYYLTFVTGVFYQSMGKDFRRNFRPLFMQADGVTPSQYKWVYDIISWLVTQIGFGYLVQPFVLLDLAPSIAMWGSVNYIGHLFILAEILIFHGPFKRKVTGMLKKLRPVSEAAIPKTPSDRIKAKSEKLKTIRKEIEKLQSELDEEPVLGLPQPDLDTIDDDVKSALEEFEQIKNDLSREIESFRASRYNS